MATPLPTLRILLSLGLIAAGVASVRYPRRIARYEEMLDAIGSTRRVGDVEPADWKVSLTRAGGVILVIAGVLWSVPALGALL